MNQTINQCAQVARDKGYQLFGIQYYGECWAGGTDYDRWGGADNCDSYKDSMMFGSHWSNYVYRLNQVGGRDGLWWGGGGDRTHKGD